MSYSGKVEMSHPKDVIMPSKKGGQNEPEGHYYADFKRTKKTKGNPGSNK